MTRSILALDLGQHTGWATVDKDGHIASGMKKFERGKTEQVGAVWLRFFDWLEEIIRSSGCEIVVYEEVRAHAGTMAAHWYGGFLSHMHAAAQRLKLPCRGVEVKSIKFAVCNDGAATKQDVIKAMVALGHNPKDDNEADALAILHWAIDNYRN